MNKLGQNIPPTKEETALRGYKRRNKILIIVIVLLIIVIGIQIVVMLT
ncbi:MAG: hypothetical protein RBS24_03535 [Bacilli bacterium]|jgi:cell division septal protein FtsQ|nr:hypothetical protein [Bacilli bacterium]